jgi:Cu/Ag efflux pump CusA
VSEKLQLVREALPAEVEAPVLAPVSSIMGEILFVALESDRHTPMEVRTAADFTCGVACSRSRASRRWS